MSRRATLASSIILLATSSLASHAEEPRARSGSAETQKAPESAKTDSANAAGTGLKAYIDPKTGKPGPVPAPTRRTEVVAPKSPFGLRNDALMSDRNPRGRNHHAAHRRPGADGDVCPIR